MRYRRAVLCVTGLVLALAGPGVTAEPGGQGPDLRRVTLDDLIDAAKRVRPDIQMKVTWCGPQTKSVPTIVLGTLGHRLNADKYVPLRREGWSYANDDPPSIRYYQLTPDEWTRALTAMKAAGWAGKVNPSEPEFERRIHVVLVSTGWQDRSYDWAELFLDADTPSLRALFLGALAEHDPAGLLVENRLFRGS